MSIMPITNFSLNTKNNYTSFEGNKKHIHYDYDDSTIDLKSIPLATLIAMSPMVEAPAQTMPGHSDDKVMMVVPIKNAHTGKTCEVRFISNDDVDSDIESLVLYNKVNRPNGYTTKQQDVYEIYKDGNKYYAVGPAFDVDYEYKKYSGKDTIVRKNSSNSNKFYRNDTREIDKEVYNYLSQFPNIVDVQK